MVIGNQIFSLTRQGLSYHIFPVKRGNNCLQTSNFTRNRELIRITETTAELKCEPTVKLIGLIPHPTPTSTQIKPQTFLSPFGVTALQVTSSDESPFHQQRGSRTFHNPVSCLKYKTIL